VGKIMGGNWIDVLNRVARPNTEAPASVEDAA